MNRKSLFIVILILASLTLHACGQGKEQKPENISEAHYNYGLKALEIVDSYLDFDSTSEEAQEKMDALIKEQGNLPETEFKDANHLKNSNVEHHITMLSYSLSKVSYGKGTYDDVLSKRNDLAKVLNEKDR